MDKIMDDRVDNKVDGSNTLDYYNTYDDLNEFYINSYDLEAEIVDNKKTKKGIKIVSDKDSIHFVHEDDASDRHKQIHVDTDKPSTTKSTSTKTSNDKFAKKKEEIRKRLENKTKSDVVKDVLDSIDRTYTSNKSKTAKSTTSTYSSTKTSTYNTTKKKKTSVGTIIILLFAIFSLFGPMILSFLELIADEFNTQVPGIVYELLEDEEDNYDDYEFEPEQYTGEPSELKQIYEITDSNQENPFYYSEDGTLYDSDYYTVEYDCEAYNFLKEDIADMRVRSYKAEYGDDEDFVCTFIDPDTHIAYYILAGEIYDCNNETIDEDSIVLPPEAQAKLDEYRDNN